MNLNTKKDFAHLSKVVSKRESRPILTGINYEKESQMLVACDSHRLLRIKSTNEILVDMTINIKSGQILEGQYPNTQRIVPNQGITVTLDTQNLDKKITVASLKAYKKENIYLSFEDEKMNFKHKENTFLSVDLGDAGLNGNKALFNGEYIFDLFSYLVDLPKHEMKILYSSPIRPILFTEQNSYEYVVTPIREN